MEGNREARMDMGENIFRNLGRKFGPVGMGDRKIGSTERMMNHKINDKRKTGLQWPAISRFSGCFARMMYRGFKGDNRRSTEIKCTKKKQQTENVDFFWKVVDCSYTFLASGQQLLFIPPNLRQIRAFAVPIFFEPRFVRSRPFFLPTWRQGAARS